MKSASRHLIFALLAISAATTACGNFQFSLGGGAAPTPGDGNLPMFESDPDKMTDIMDGGGGVELFALVNEPEQDEMYSPGVQRYSVDFKADAQVDISTGWCAKDAQTREENKSHYQGLIEVNGYRIPSSQLKYYEWEIPAGAAPDMPDGGACFSWDIIAMQWPVGAHTVREGWTFDQDVNDGYADYAAGEYALEYQITVTK
jgi:hypothetical protein